MGAKMFKFEQLDKKKTYVGLQCSKTLLGKKIVKYSKEYAPNSSRIPSHVMGLKFRYGSWWIFESHITGNKKYNIRDGVVRTRQDVWEKIENPEEYEVYPLKLKVRKLEEYIGLPYGVGDIKELLQASLFHTNGKQKDHNGLICSEYIALCNDYVCKYYNLPAYCITPAHFQNYFDSKNIQAVGK